MKHQAIKFLLGVAVCLGAGFLLSQLYCHRWIIRFAINNRVPCVLWTKKFRANADALVMITPILPQAPIIVEAGAYNGDDSAVLANRWPQGYVHCFEPIPELYKVVLEVTKDSKNLSAYPLALADKEGVADFYVSSSDAHPDVPSASSSLLQPEQHLEKAPNVLFKKKIQVQTITLDQWADENKIDHIDFMWLDTQGSELSILKHGQEILKTVKVVLMEVEFVEAYKNQPLFSEIKTWMESQGFRLEAIHLGCDWYGDALFVRNEL